MPDFVQGGTPRTPVGKNQYLRSTKNPLFDGFTFAKGAIPTETIDGHADQKVLQPGTVIATITSGADTGKVGVFDTGASDGRQTSTNIVGINETWLPWQLMERDVEVAVLYSGVVKQAWCFQYTNGVRATLSDTVRDYILAIARLKTVVFD